MLTFRYLNGRPKSDMDLNILGTYDIIREACNLTQNIFSLLLIAKLSLEVSVRVTSVGAKGFA